MNFFICNIQFYPLLFHNNRGKAVVFLIRLQLHEIMTCAVHLTKCFSSGFFIINNFPSVNPTNHVWGAKKNDDSFKTHKFDVILYIENVLDSQLVIGFGLLQL